MSDYRHWTSDEEKYIQEARAHGKRHKSPGGPNGAGWDAEFR